MLGVVVVARSGLPLMLGKVSCVQCRTRGSIGLEPGGGGGWTGSSSWRVSLGSVLDLFMQALDPVFEALGLFLEVLESLL